MERNFGLDLLRTLSIWLVILQHAGIQIPGLFPLQTGAIGVEIFFVLSGFLIGGILLKEIDKNKTIREKLRSFWIRRWFRILPLYYLVLIFKFIVIDHSIGWHIFIYFTFLQNNFYGIQFYPVTWSLVIEEWFYIFAPLFLIFLHKLFTDKNKILIALLAFLVLENLLRLTYVLVTNAPYEGVNGNFPFRFDALFLGVILAFLRYNGHKAYKILESKFVFGAGLLLFIGYLFIFYDLAKSVNGINQLLFPRTIGFFIFSFSISLMVPFVTKLKTIDTKYFGTRSIFNFITQTSILTYAIYLTHPLIYPFTVHNDHIHYYIIRLALGLGSTYLVSYLIYTFFEKPFLNYREIISERKKK